MFHRLNVCVNLLTATLISIIYVPFPDICDDILFFLVKRLTSLINRDGEYHCKNFCGCVRPDEQDACSVVEENEQSDGSVGHEQADEFGRISGPESDGEEHDKQS